MQQEITINKKTSINQDCHQQLSIPQATINVSLFMLDEGCLKVLLLKKTRGVSDGKMQLPQAKINPGKDKNLQNALLRYLQEDIKLRPRYIEQVKTVGSWQDGSASWMIQVMYLGLVCDFDYPGLDCQWVDVNELSLVKGLMHSDLISIRSCVKRLRNKARYTSVLVHALPCTFTFSELLHIHEVVLNVAIEKKAFRRRWQQTGLLESTHDKRCNGASRPARIFQVKSGHVCHFFARTMEGTRYED